MRLIDADKLETHDVFNDEVWVIVYKEDIDAQPTIDAEPIRHGKWIPLYPHDAPITNLYKCSVCGLGYEDDDTDCPVYYPWKYCPHCGALME